MKREAILTSVALATALFAAVGAALFLLPPAPHKISYEIVGYSDLIGWQEDDHAAALGALNQSCNVWQSQPPARSLSGGGIGGVVSDWAKICEQAAAPISRRDARKFFEDFFTPVQIINGPDRRGLLTGYYEPLLRGSWSPRAMYTVPLYQRPPELVTVDLSPFRPDLSGRRVAGSVHNGRLVPFPSRAEIEAGALQGRGLELLWVDDIVDAFFLQIQGSGRIIFEDGSMIRIGYAGPNGHPYTSLGGLMAEKGLLNRKDISLQSIRSWLRDNPAEGRLLMQKNKSFTFFRLLEGEGPIGSGGFVLTAERSLAVDRRFVPLGVPVWISGTQPDEKNPTGEPVALHRLLVAQDTGGAISGPLRGDVFWGFGERAEILAGHMAHGATFYILLPKAVATRLEDSANEATAK